MNRTLRAALRALRWGVTLLVGAGVAVLLLHRSEYPVVLGRYSQEYLAFLGAVVAFALVLMAVLWVLPRRGDWLRAARRNVAPSLAVLLVSTVASFGALELLLRTTDLFGVSFYGEVRRYMDDLQPDPSLIVRHREGLRTTYQGVDVRTNELGLRERPLDDLPEGRRVLMLGNSVTFGWGVEEEETYAREIEAALGGRVTTINAGVSGYNTTQVLRFLERHGDALDPDVVVVMYVDNDIDPLGPPPENMAGFAGILEHPALSLDYTLGRSWAFSIFRHILPALLLPSEPDPAAPGWRESMASLEAIAAWGRARDVPVHLYLYRMASTPLTELLHDSLTALSAREGIRYEDALPWFEGLEVRELTISFIDSHPNAEGHDVLGRGIARSLDRSGTLARAEGPPRK